MVDVNRYRAFVGPKGKNSPPGQPDPPVSYERQLYADTLGNEQMDVQGGPMQVPDLAPGVDDPDAQGYREGRPPFPESEIVVQPPSAEPPADVDWSERARKAYRSSTDFMDSNFRQKLEDGLRAFNNEHPSDSKYRSETFKRRSNLYRPKFRTIVRKNEAALCAALFSNLDLIELSAANPGDQAEIVSAEVMQQLIQERLTVTMPWFQFAMGAMQDAHTQGIVIAHSYWKYRGTTDRTGEYRVHEDRPIQELIPLENFRFDPSAKWYDVVNTSPYIIELIPMYVDQVRERMRNPDPKGRKWRDLDDSTLAASTMNDDETTRMARTGIQQDAASQPREIKDYDIVWVHRHIHRYEGEDWEFYTLASKWMLTDPEPLVDNVWFGERPYVAGCCMLETHKALANSPATIYQPLIEEANDLQNQTSDNLKFILNKAWFYRRDANVDVAALVRNAPGRAIALTDPERDVKEVSWPDIPRAAYEGMNRNDADFSQLAGDFNPMQLGQTRSPRESWRTVNAVQSPAMMMTEYTLMTLVQTFLLPCLRQLVLLEQHYETDATMLALAGQKAKVMQKFGVNEVTDAILEKRMSVNINIGMGATDPTTKLQRLTAALGAYAKLAQKPPPGLDLKEAGKEFVALAGYREGMRFFPTEADPEKVQMAKVIKVLEEKLKSAQVEKKDRHESNVVRLITAREKNITDLARDMREDDHQTGHLLIGHLMQLQQADRASEASLQQQAEGAQQQQMLKAQGAQQQQPQMPGMPAMPGMGGAPGGPGMAA